MVKLRQASLCVLSLVLLMFGLDSGGGGGAPVRDGGARSRWLIVVNTMRLYPYNQSVVLLVLSAHWELSVNTLHKFRTCSWYSDFLLNCGSQRRRSRVACRPTTIEPFAARIRNFRHNSLMEHCRRTQFAMHPQVVISATVKHGMCMDACTIELSPPNRHRRSAVQADLSDAYRTCEDLPI